MAFLRVFLLVLDDLPLGIAEGIPQKTSLETMKAIDHKVKPDVESQQRNVPSHTNHIVEVQEEVPPAGGKDMKEKERKKVTRKHRLIQ